MNTKIKICGIMRDEDCDSLNELMPDFAGFVFAKGRRRYILPETARRFREKLDKRIKTVGVFLNEDIETVLSIAKSGIIDAVQLHGSETDDMIGRIKTETGLPVIKAFMAKGAVDVDSAMSSPADTLLFDNGCGTGERFDWEMLEDVDRIYFLAGGLSPENVGEAVKRYNPYGVDVSSGVETDGQKDFDKIRRFIEAVRNADNA